MKEGSNLRLPTGIVDPRFLILGSNDDPIPVRTETGEINFGRVDDWVREGATRFGIPNPRGRIFGSGDYLRAIGAELGIQNGTHVLKRRADRLARLRVPDAGSMVERRGDDPPAIRTELDPHYVRLV